VPVTLALAERTDAALAQSQPPGGGGAGSAPGGLQVRELTAAEKSQAGVPSGVIVTGVEEGGAAEDAGLQPGDLIEEVGGRPVSSAEALGKALRDAKASGKQHAVLLVTSDGNTRYVPLRLE
jgi:serine protease Do